MPLESNNGNLKVIFIASIIFASNCLIISEIRATPEWIPLFSNGFEEPQLISAKGDGWTKIREKKPCKWFICNKRPSRVQVVSGIAHSGSKSLACFADGGDADTVAKADIYKTNLSLKMGETYRVSAWYRLPSETYVKTISIMDLECDNCGGKTSGVRIWIGQRRDSEPPKIVFHRGKLALKSYKGTRPLPLGEWFKVTVEVTLGAGDAGHSRVWINDRLDIDEPGTNIKPEHYPRLVHYNFLQFGVTANATGTAPHGLYTGFTLHVDDVLIEQKMNGSN